MIYMVLACLNQKPMRALLTIVRHLSSFSFFSETNQNVKNPLKLCLNF